MHQTHRAPRGISGCAMNRTSTQRGGQSAAAAMRSAARRARFALASVGFGAAAHIRISSSSSRNVATAAAANDDVSACVRGRVGGGRGDCLCACCSVGPARHTCSLARLNAPFLARHHLSKEQRGGAAGLRALHGRAAPAAGHRARAARRVGRHLCRAFLVVFCCCRGFLSVLCLGGGG
jgi:hypothetical protein